MLKTDRLMHGPRTSMSDRDKMVLPIWSATAWAAYGIREYVYLTCSQPLHARL